MKKKVIIFSFFSLFIFFVAKINNSFAREYLVIVDQISRENKTFLINLGLDDGILGDMRGLFSTDHFSFVSKAVLVTKTHSLWESVDPRFDIPFKASERVIFDTNPAGIYEEIPEMVAFNSKISLIQKEFLKDRLRHQPYTFKLSLMNGFLESSSLSENKTSSSGRLGQRVSFLGNFIFDDRILLHLGLRYDSETQKILDPAVTIPTKRYLALAGVTYHLRSRHIQKGAIPYIHILGGYGITRGFVASDSLSGTAMVVPQLTLGSLFKYSAEISLLLEAGGEALFIQETFADGTNEKSTIFSGILTLGLSF